MSHEFHNISIIDKAVSRIDTFSQSEMSKEVCPIFPSFVVSKLCPNYNQYEKKKHNYLDVQGDPFLGFNHRLILLDFHLQKYISILIE